MLPKFKKSDIAKRAGVTRACLDRILNKQVDNPGIKTLRSIAEAIGCDFLDLGY